MADRPRENNLLPPVRVTEKGRPRRVGVEIEFAGPELPRVAQVLGDFFGGQVKRETDYEYRIETSLGTFKAEVDQSLLKRLGKLREEQPEEAGALEQISEQLLASVVRQVMPLEIVTPPLPMDRLADMDLLVTRLGQEGGEGTAAAWHYAFGVHFNPEAPSLRAETLLGYLRAFVLLYDWLKRELDVDTARRVSPFIKPFPARYVELILRSDYRPNLSRLIDDYLQDNPTRNRALDMLPLFAHLDKDRVQAVVDDPLVTPRPTFHYRLSNSRVGDPRWRVTDEWRYWLVVEGLAVNPDKQARMAADFLQLLERPLGDIFAEWTDKTEQWLKLH